MFLLTFLSFSQETPLIDRNLFFGNPEISSAQLSPDGNYLSFLKEYEGIMNIWVKKIDEPFDKAKPLTDSKRPLAGYFWSEDSKNILYVKDKDGDENLNVFVVNPYEITENNKLPLSRNLTPLKDIRARIQLVSKKNPDKIIVAINDRDKAWHDLFELQISTGKLTRIFENENRITGFNFDWDENLRLLYQTDEKGNNIIYRILGDTVLKIYETNVKENAYVVGWTEDNSKVYLVSNKGDVNFSTLYLLNIDTGEKVKIASDPKNKVDIDGVYLNDLTHKLTSIDYIYDKKEIHWLDKYWEAVYKLLKTKFPNQEVDFESVSKDHSKFLVSIWSDTFVSKTYFFDAKTNHLVYQYTPQPELKKYETHFAEMKPITYLSSDGLEIPAYLTLPKGKELKNLPVVVLVHGGPKGPRDVWGFNSAVQFLANRGYAVLQPNFRASGGYGKKFLNAGDLQWGKLMQDDITWGIKHLINQGIADKNRVAIMGGSYGGYATLAGLTFTPDMYAGGVDIVGPSNINTLLDSVPAYWEAFKAALYEMVGNPETEEGKKRINEASPLFSVDKITKPLLIIQGANDPRVKQAESDQIVVALRDKGKKVEYLLADDEGHGFKKPINNLAMFAQIEKFLSEIIGGRHQKEIPQDIEKRLKELTVDISKVTYTPAEKPKTATSLPKLISKIKPQTINYNVMIEMEGQQVPLEMTRKIEKSGKNWVITDASKGMISGSEETIYSNEFIPISRTISQEDKTIEGKFKDNVFSLNLPPKGVNLTFNGAYISDGPGFDIVIGALPLTKDYSIILEMPDVMSAKVKQVLLKVLGEHEINKRKCTVVELTSTSDKKDKILLSINEEGFAERIEQNIPTMGNAKFVIQRK